MVYLHDNLNRPLESLRTKLGYNLLNNKLQIDVDRNANYKQKYVAHIF